MTDPDALPLPETLDASLQPIVAETGASQPVVLLARELAALQHAFVLRYEGHVRLTRRLSGLDTLIAQLQGLQARALQAAPAQEGRWPLLLDVMERRLAQWQEERGAIAQLQAASHSRDREAALLTSRARFVLHRFVRHFAGQSRRSRDAALLREMRDDLQAHFAQLRPLATAGIHLRTVAEEIGAVGGFVQFFEAELGELAAARMAGSLADQSDTWGMVLRTLRDGWQVEVGQLERRLRRPALVQRYASAMDEALEGLLTIRHANLPDAHERRVQEAATLAAQWQEEADTTQAVVAATSDDERRALLLSRARDLYIAWRSQSRPEPQPGDQSWLRPLCDQLDEIERQWTLLVAQMPADGYEPDGPQHQASDDLAWLRDTLVAMERAYDGAAV